MSNTETETPHDYAGSRRYVCTSCDTVVRARWDQWGDGYPGYFEVGCDCTIAPVVPEMSQAETPDNWRVERPDCCRGVDVKDLEDCYGGVSDYRCPDCGATYRWDGTMSTAPDSEEQPDPPDDQQLLTDGGTDQHVESVHRMVVISPYGEKYHRKREGQRLKEAACGGFSQSNLWIVTEGEALDQGYSACSNCTWEGENA